MILLLRVRQKFSAVSSPEETARIGREIIAAYDIFDQQKESVIALGLNTKNKVQYADLISLGILDASLVHPREVFRRAVAEGMSGIALMHNHPSGDVTPSREDKVVTERLIKAGKTIGIEVLDHVIVGNDTTDYYSFRQQSTIDSW